MVHLVMRYIAGQWSVESAWSVRENAETYIDRQTNGGKYHIISESIRDSK